MRRSIGSLWAIFLLALPAPEAGAVHVRGKVVRVGISGSGHNTAGADWYRPGYWMPVLVELNNDDGDLFEGIVQVAQIDRDGDQVIASIEVAVRGTRQYYLYVPATSFRQESKALRVRVLNLEGGTIPLHDDSNQRTADLRPATEAHAVSPTAQFVLDISRQALPQLARMNDPNLTRELVIGRLSPEALPDSVAGLDMVDVIVWDDANPGDLRDVVVQAQALLDWTRRGGTLVLTIGRNWEMLQRSPLAAILPAPLGGATSSTSLPELSKAIRSLELDFERPITYCPIRRADLAPDARPIIPAQPAGPDTEIFAATRPVGRGRVVLVAAELRDILPQATSEAAVLRELLGVRREYEARPRGLMPRDLFSFLENATSFRVTTGLYFLAAFGFVTVYILIATAGSWRWLKRRQRTTLAWLAFALVSLVASGASLAAVQFIRGVGHQVQQVTVLDMRAGDRNGIARCYFGLKTASHLNLDLAVPDDPANPDSAENAGALMPLPDNPDKFAVSVYSAGQRYRAVALLGQLWSVPLRATLKQFQGIWEGDTGGQIDASLRRRSSGTILLTPSSWIQNDTGHELQNCYLLIAQQNPGGTLTGETVNPHRFNTILAYAIGTLPPGRITWGEISDRQLEKEFGRPLMELADRDWSPKLLSETHANWLRGLNWTLHDDYYDRDSRNNRVEISPAQVYNALLLLSTYSEGDPRMFTSEYRSIDRSRGLDLDRSDFLTRDTGLLVGFSSTPGPARLAWRPTGVKTGGWETIEPFEGTTMYRVAIPITSP